MANNPALNITGATTPTRNYGSVTGVLAPTNPAGIGTSAQMRAPTPTGQPLAGSTSGLMSKPTTQTAQASGRNITAIPTADIQRNLGITSDGDYGPQTTAAVKAFQQQNGLTADGIFGPQTMAAYNAKYSKAPVTQQQQTQGAQQPQQFDYSQILSGMNQPTTYQPTESLYGQLAVSQANAASQPSPEYTAAQEEAKRISEQQTKLAQDYAQKYKNIEGTAGFLTQASGLEGLLQNQYNIGQEALSQQYAGATNRLSAANTQQQIQQQGLANAAQTAQPILGAYGQANYGVGGAGGTAQPGSPMYASMQQLARGLSSGSIPPNSPPLTAPNNPALPTSLAGCFSDNAVPTLPAVPIIEPCKAPFAI